MTKHTGQATAGTCGRCIFHAKSEAHVYTDSEALEFIMKHRDRFIRKHAAAIRSRESRNARADAYRSLGMTRVRGANGGIYWE